MKIFLDDLRIAPEGWTLARNPEDFWYLFNGNLNAIEEISLDHDLGYFDDDGNEIKGVHILNEIEEMFGGLYPPFHIYVHSDNSSGVQTMVQAINRMAERSGIRIPNPQRKYSVD